MSEYRICYWDSDDNSQKERDATPEEVQAILERKRAALIPNSAIINPPILMALKEIDEKSIRALRTNDQVRLAELESQAQVLRSQLIGETNA